MPAKKVLRKKGEIELTEVPIASLVLSSDLQMRCHLDESRVEDYQSLLDDAGDGEWPFAGDADGRIRVGKVGGKLFVYDGYHRLEAASRSGRMSVPVEVKLKATKALLFRWAMDANRTHGLPYTREDQRRRVVLAVSQWPSYSERKISDIVGVGRSVVRTVMAKLKDVDVKDLTTEELEEVAVKTKPPKKGTSSKKAAGKGTENGTGKSKPKADPKDGAEDGSKDGAGEDPGIKEVGSGGKAVAGEGSSESSATASAPASEVGESPTSSGSGSSGSGSAVQSQEVDGSKVNLRLKKIGELQTILGKATRMLVEVGIFDESEKHMERIMQISARERKKEEGRK